MKRFNLLDSDSPCLTKTNLVVSQIVYIASNVNNKNVTRINIIFLFITINKLKMLIKIIFNILNNKIKKYF